jgi:hypothetical protein
MAQRTTAFDAVSTWAVDKRSVIAIVGALMLGALATGLSYRADGQQPAAAPHEEAA